MMLQATSSSSENARKRSNSFSREPKDSLLQPLISSPVKSSLKCPVVDPKNKSGPRRNSFCVSMEVKQKHSSLKTLGLFK